ncbi:TetR/AcrR family transcriptional regulator [Clostridium paraputrificum]|uniref:TetR/AcrR family transcriptional regulator n=1 Tax=Clostridium TaxID=1485 RepID=UPI003D355ACB
MPKKILNLQEKIFEAAWNLFSEKGYDNVDMKAIAKGCDIAVGTLYNYYGNKKDLFLTVLGASWTGTFDKIDDAIQKCNDKKECIHKIIEILYYDIKERRGMGKYLVENNSFSKEENDKINEEVLDKIYEVIIKNFELTIDERGIEYKAKKLTDIIICNVVLLARLYQEEDERNIRFLNQIVDENMV